MNTYDSVVKYLKSYWELNHEINEYRRLMEGVKAISYSQEAKGTVLAKDMMLVYMVKIEEAQTKQLEVIRFIEKNFKGIEGAIMSGRYIGNMTLKEIGNMVNYSKSQVKYRHDKAIYRYLAK